MNITRRILLLITISSGLTLFLLWLCGTISSGLQVSHAAAGNVDQVRNYANIGIEDTDPVVTDIAPNSVLANTGDLPVTISGINFSTPISATLDGVLLLSQTLISTTTLEAVVPVNSLETGVYNLTVTSGGISSTLADAFTVYSSNFLPFIDSCQPLYYDNYNDPNSGWYTGDDEIVKVEYLNGEYRILVRKPNILAAGVRSGFQAQDYILSVDVRNPNNADGSYGLAFGISGDWSGWYSFEISQNGDYRICRYYDGGNSADCQVGWSNAIHTGTASNSLKIVRNGANIKAYINWKFVRDRVDSNYGGSRYVGLFVVPSTDPNLDVRYDNFLVLPVACEK